MPKASKPTGFSGKLLARGIALEHRSFYKNTAKIKLKDDDKYLEIGFGSDLFIKKYASHLSRIAGIDCSEDMVKLAVGLGLRCNQAPLSRICLLRSVLWRLGCLRLR